MSLLDINGKAQKASSYESAKKATQNLDSINFAPLHPTPAHLDKHLDSVNYTLNPVAHPNLDWNLDSTKMHPKPCTHPKTWNLKMIFRLFRNAQYNNKQNLYSIHYRI